LFKKTANYKSIELSYKLYYTVWCVNDANVAVSNLIFNVPI